MSFNDKFWQVVISISETYLLLNSNKQLGWWNGVWGFRFNTQKDRVVSCSYLNRRGCHRGCIYYVSRFIVLLWIKIFQVVKLRGGRYSTLFVLYYEFLKLFGKDRFSSQCLIPDIPPVH